MHDLQIERWIKGVYAMKWFFLTVIGISLFLVWHAHTIFGEDD